VHQSDQLDGGSSMIPKLPFRCNAMEKRARSGLVQVDFHCPVPYICQRGTHLTAEGGTDSSRKMLNKRHESAFLLILNRT
jgi:hypothetical protein